MVTVQDLVNEGDVLRPPFDRELAEFLVTIGPNAPRLHAVDDIHVLRERLVGAHAITDEELSCDGKFHVYDQLIPGPPASPDVSVLICRPVGVSEPTPAFFYVHGGGMVLGDNRLGLHEYALTWAREFDAAVVSVEYRLAPESPHPGPVEDCYAGLLWTFEHAEDLGIDTSRIFITGASGGGGLAAATTLLARDRGGLDLAGQILMCPMIDDRNETISAHQFDGVGIWDRSTNMVAWKALLGESCGDANVSPSAAPARATNLAGLPPTFIDVGSAETFRDESIAYAQQIWEAGGDAELHVWAGGFHGYDGMAPETKISQNTAAARLGWLHRQMLSTTREISVD